MLAHWYKKKVSLPTFSLPYYSPPLSQALQDHCKPSELDLLPEPASIGLLGMRRKLCSTFFRSRVPDSVERAIIIYEVLSYQLLQTAYHIFLPALPGVDFPRRYSYLRLYRCQGGNPWCNTEGPRRPIYITQDCDSRTFQKSC